MIIIPAQQDDDYFDDDNYDNDDHQLSENLQKTPNLFLRQESSGAQVKFSDNEEVTMETVGLRSHFV